MCVWNQKMLFQSCGFVPTSPRGNKKILLSFPNDAIHLPIFSFVVLTMYSHVSYILLDIANVVCLMLKGIASLST